ncbi:hypothetical protein MMC08_006763 [Hypocenomyce scalaris]|nr:hypothetical protein [Hypocenomyce scalaris]
MPSGTIANLANFTELSEGMGFQVMPSPGHVYDRSASDMLYVANFDVFGAPDGSFATGPVISPSNAVSWECAMWMCIQAFATQMVDLNQTQPVVRNFSQVVNSTLPGGFSGNDNFSFVDLPIAMNPRSGANYLVGIMASLAIEGYLEPIFNGTIFLNLESQTFSSDYIQAIWNASSDLDGWIKNLASSMTNVIRTETPQPNDFYNGKGYQLGVQVHWPWIALPVVLVALSLITLIVTMIRTARSPVRAWKGSPLALLFMEVDQDIRRRVSGQMNTYNGIDSFVSKSKVVLRSDGDGSWIFKGTQ